MTTTARKVLYLDQLFVSNLAKVDRQSDWKDQLRPFYAELLSILRALVAQNRIICPTSSFHEEESERGRRVRDIAWPIAEELSDGVSFRGWTDIYLDQVISAARAYCGLDVHDIPTWRIPFNKDPQQPRPEEERLGFRVHVGFSEEFVEHGRQLKDQIQNQYAKFKKWLASHKLPFDELVAFLKYEILRETFSLGGTINTGNPALDEVLSATGILGLAQKQTALTRILKQCDHPEGFAKSDQLLGCHHLHIRAYLMAADIHFFPFNWPSASLNTDFDIIASVLPYVDILATDRHMADLIQRSHLSARYTVQVFTVHRRSEFIRVLKSLGQAAM